MIKKIIYLFLTLLIINSCQSTQNIQKISKDKNGRIALFKTLNLGRNNELNYQKMAEVMTRFDLIGLMDVADEKGILSLLNQIGKYRGEEWEYLISEHATGYNEYPVYSAFIWSTSRVSLIKNLRLYPGKQLSKLAYQPFAASFMIGNIDFTIILVDFQASDDLELKQADAQQLPRIYQYYLNDEMDVIFAGSFNLPPDDEAYTDINKRVKGGKFIIPVQKLTEYNINMESFDNFFLTVQTAEYKGNNGIYNYNPENNPLLKKTVSDHLPIYLILETTKDDD